MDLQSRETASNYINNLLLSRGLLRNGIPIEFATPEKVEGGVHATMAQVMNLRESDTLASLSQNLQTLRTSSTQQSQNITRLESRNVDLDRQLALTSAQERAARATLRSAETRNKALREEMARLKATVAQIRAQCATDIRRRDVELQRLKRHIEGRRGRDGYGGQVGMVVITPGMSKGPQGKRKGETETDLESPAYSLKQETTDFLTQLSQGLSDENDALISLVRGTLATLRSLQGLPSDFGQTSENDAVPEGFESAPGFMGGPPSYEALASSTDEVLEHLRGLLTNPSFVPVEEVEIREEEIHRLREGWEKMAARWKEAVALMDGWKKRMVDTGDTINLDDLKVGLNLGSGIATALETQDMNHEGKADADESEILKNIHEDFEEPSNEGEENVSFGLEIDLHATGRVLGDKDANARQPPTSSKVWFSPIPEEVKENTSLLDFSNPKAPRFYASGMHLKTQPTILSPERTIQQKLERAKAEAEEARRREDVRPRRESTSKSVVTKKLKGNRRRSTLSPEELEKLMGIS